ncbi:hypothetical protein V8B97DRAFT_1942579 [Scleroderma yunnanense]
MKMPPSANQRRYPEPPPTPSDMPQSDQNQDTTPGGKDGPTRNKETAMQELVMSAVGTALRPVTSRLDDLQQKVDPVIAYVNNNTVAKHTEMLQTHLNPMNRSLGTLQDQVERVERRFDPLNEHLDSVQHGILRGVDQKCNTLEQAVQTAHKDIRTVSDTQVVTKALTADVLVNSYQVYNSACGSGLTRPFKVIPFIREGGETESPSASGLPLLHDVPTINNIEDEELDLYLREYDIVYDGLSRAAKLRKLRVHIGCTPEDEKPMTHSSTLVVMLLLGVAFFVLFPDHFLSI